MAVPSTPPSPLDPDAAQVEAEWQKLSAISLPQMRASASRWRDGLAALVTIVTTGLVISGPESVGRLPGAWRWWVAGLLVGGLLVAVAGLLFALMAAAGRPRILTREEFGRTWKTVAALEAHDAKAARTDLRWARWLAAAGILGIVAGTGLWVLSPTAASEPAAQLEVTTATETLCGVLVSSTLR